MRRPEAENQTANRHLRARLIGSGAVLSPAEAIAPADTAGLWREPGFLVCGLGRTELVRIAERYGQNAIVWIGEDGIPWLVAARDGFGGVRTGDTLPLIPRR